MGDYTFVCSSSVAFDGSGNAIAFYNDPDEDCISNDFIVIFTDSDGDISYYDNNDWQTSEPSSGGFYDFNNDPWRCCDDTTDYIGNNWGSGGGGGGSLSETCILSTACNGCQTGSDWLDCIIDCGGC